MTIKIDLPLWFVQERRFAPSFSSPSRQPLSWKQWKLSGAGNVLFRENYCRKYVIDYWYKLNLHEGMAALTIVKGLSMSVVNFTASFSATESFFLFRLTCFPRLFCSFFLLLFISFWLRITAYTIREPGIRFTKLICNGFVSVLN